MITCGQAAALTQSRLSVACTKVGRLINTGYRQRWKGIPANIWDCRTTPITTASRLDQVINRRPPRIQTGETQRRYPALTSLWNHRYCGGEFDYCLRSSAMA